MRIAIDGRTIAKDRTGVGEYAYRIVSGLLSLDKKNEYTLFLIEPNEDIQAPNLTKVMIVGYDRMVLNRYWENILLPQYIRKYNIDLYFGPAYALPALPRWKTLGNIFPFSSRIHDLFNNTLPVKYVVTIHDIIAYVLPQYFTPKMRMWQHYFVNNAIYVAHRIIVDSEHTKYDLAHFYQFAKEKITVVPLAPHEQYRTVTDQRTLSEVKKKYNLPERYILFVGTIEPRKNVVGLVEAYSRLPENIQSQYKLVVAGNFGWYSGAIMDAINKFQLGNKLSLIGYIERSDLPAIYSMATLFVFPSFYEGFGYPPLEAMSCGVPVITSNNSSLPEVVGDTATLIDPHNIEELSAEMKHILTNESVKQSMRERGLERSKQFTWEKNAEQTLRVFEEVISS